MKRYILLFWVTLLAVTLCPPAYANDASTGTPWERFSVSLGGFGALSNSDVRIGTNVLGGGIDIDIEEALNVDVQQSAVRLSALYRIGEKRRHRVGLSWFEFRRSGTAVVAEEIEIGEPPITLPVGDVVNTVYNTGILKADYGYSFFMDERFNLAVSGGLFVMPIEIGIDNITTGESTKTDITAPLPVVGFSFDYALSPKWMIKQRMELLYLKFGDFTGALLNTNFGVEWNVWDNWGFGAQIESFRMAIDSQSDSGDVPGVDFEGSIKMSYTGLGLYTRYRF